MIYKIDVGCINNVLFFIPFFIAKVNNGSQSFMFYHFRTKIIITETELLFLFCYCLCLRKAIYKPSDRNYFWEFKFRS